MRTRDTTAVIDELPSIGPLFDYMVIAERVVAYCVACGERFDTVGRPARAIKLWTTEHVETSHAVTS